MDNKENKPKTKSITVKILNINEGLIEYEDVKYIRIKSRYYNLMIMKDYLPIIGEVDGDIKFELVNDTIRLNGIKGYFMNKQNQFNLFIQDKISEKPEIKENNKQEQNIEKKIKDKEENIIDNEFETDILESDNKVASDNIQNLEEEEPQENIENELKENINEENDESIQEQQVDIQEETDKMDMRENEENINIEINEDEKQIDESINIEEINDEKEISGEE